MPTGQTGAERSAGIAPANAVPQDFSQHAAGAENAGMLLHDGCTNVSLGELLASWPWLSHYVVQAIIDLVRNPRG
jgi:hypothetical protein